MSDRTFEISGIEGGNLTFGYAAKAHRIYIFYVPDSAGSISLSADKAEFMGEHMLEISEEMRRIDAIRLIKCHK